MSDQTTQQIIDELEDAKKGLRDAIDKAQQNKDLPDEPDDDVDDSGISPQESEEVLGEFDNQLNDAMLNLLTKKDEKNNV